MGKSSRRRAAARSSSLPDAKDEQERAELTGLLAKDEKPAVLRFAVGTRVECCVDTVVGRLRLS